MVDWGTGWLSRLTAAGLDKRLPVLAMLLLTALLAQSLAQLTWKLLPGQVQEPLPVTTRVGSASPSAQTSSQTDIARISQWHLFGDAKKVVAKPVDKITEAPDTRLNLKLLGVLASDSATARAIIADGKGVEDAYAVGENLPGNAVLREIYADRVILEYRGRMETLRLPKEALENLSVTSQTVGQTSQRSTKQASTADNIALLRQYREALISNPQSLMDLVSASPVNEPGTGQLKGYRIRPGKDRKLLGRFGLKSGDVVTGVNGVALNNPIKALEIMRDLSTANSVTLDVERNGVVESFAFQVD
jgi:general secretion pathway protein C